METQDFESISPNPGTNAGRNVEKGKNDEGTTTRAIDHVTAKLPSTVWLIGAGGAMALSLVMKLTGRSEAANFVGQWVPTILLLGIYNKIVKVAGSDRHDTGDGQPA